MATTTTTTTTTTVSTTTPAAPEQLFPVRLFEIRCIGAGYRAWTYLQRGSSAVHARSTCEATGAHVLAIREVT